jgi:hypothetical protein
MKVPPNQTVQASTDSRWNEMPLSTFESKSNVLESLKTNLDQLEELHSRLQFMLGEIKTLIRR